MYVFVYNTQDKSRPTIKSKNGSDLSSSIWRFIFYAQPNDRNFRYVLTKFSALIQNPVLQMGWVDSFFAATLHITPYFEKIIIDIIIIVI